MDKVSVTIDPMIWVGRESGQTAKSEADRVIPIIKATPPGHRTLMFWYDNPGLWGGDHVQIIANGPNITPHKEWYTEFYNRLGDAKAVPDRLATDQEDGMSMWHITGGDGVAQMKEIYANSTALARLPDYIRKYAPEDYQCWTAKGRQAYINWNGWAALEHNRVMQEIVSKPANAIFGYVPYSNYGDCRQSFLTYDSNGWPGYDMNADWSSPSLYFAPEGQRYRNRAKHPLWNSLIGMLNIARSALAVNNKFCPWLSYCRYNCAPKQYNILVSHLAATGMKHVLLWNPVRNWPGAELIDHDTTTRDILAALRPHRRSILPEIPLDADSIDTNGLETTYDEFTA